MAKIRIEMNHDGARALLHEPGVRAELTRRAQAVEAVARANAEVDTGKYQSSIHIEQATTDRAVVRVVADDPKAMLVESRTGNLARALDAAFGGRTLVEYTNAKGKKSMVTQAQADNYNRRKKR